MDGDHSHGNEIMLATQLSRQLEIAREERDLCFQELFESNRSLDYQLILNERLLVKIDSMKKYVMEIEAKFSFVEDERYRFALEAERRTQTKDDRKRRTFITKWRT